jgi:Ser/Thr protein kinase RdoA (MazF antagonist)
MNGEVAYSILSADALKAQVASAYGIGGPGSCQLVRRRLHDTYLLTVGDDRYIVRVYRARWRSASEIGYELDLLAHLVAKGVPVSVPVAAGDGRLVLPLSAPEGTRHLVVFTYAPGEPLTWTDPDHCFLAGRLLGTIHEASEDFTSLHRRLSLDLDLLVDTPMAAIRPFLAHRPADWAWLEALAETLRGRILAAAGAGLDWGVCHGDFCGKNLHISSDHVVTTFDFDRCGPGWRVSDFAGIRQTGDGKNQATWDAFVKGYQETRPLHAGEFLFASQFQATRYVCDFGLSARYADEWGTIRMGDSRIDEWLALFKNWKAEQALVDA